MDGAKLPDGAVSLNMQFPCCIECWSERDAVSSMNMHLSEGRIPVAAMPCTIPCVAVTHPFGLRLLSLSKNMKGT